ncbi:MAG: hypothetical protein GXO08_03315 [Aquificae bacterium]|nr:hypothetical protein [Aquificota bacterium]
MVYDYLTETFKLKRLHNIRDFAYRVELGPELSLADLALFLNGLTDEAFFWTDGELLHSTSEVDWVSLLPEDLKKEVLSVERVKEGYLEEGKLPTYAAFALFAADFNRVLSPNFKANPLFKRLRRRTKEGWNLSLWMKFLHEFSINYKVERDGLEFQLWRWFAVRPDASGRLTLAFKGGVAAGGNSAEFLRLFDEKTLREFFAFRVRGSYRVGRLKGLTPEGLYELVFDGGFESKVPVERLVPIFLPEGLDWREKDRDGFLKRLRLTPKVICRYREVLVEAVNRLLEPYMVKLESSRDRWEEVKTSPFVVVDKPVPENEVVDYVFEERKVYNNPFEGKVRLHLLDLYLKSEKNKKLLRDAKADFAENLALFLKDLGLETEFEETTYGKKVKEWTLEGAAGLLEFLKGEREKLKDFNLNLVVVPFPEGVVDFAKVLPVWNAIAETLKGTRFVLLTDRRLKVFYKSQKAETKRRLLFGVLEELFRQNGGAVFVLDEPLPFGRVAVERDGYFDVYNLFGEPAGRVENFEPGEEDLVISFSSEGERMVFVDRWATPPALKVEEASGACQNAERGVVFHLSKVSFVGVLSREVPFGYKPAHHLRVGEGLSPQEALKAVFDLSKVVKLTDRRFWF